MSLPSCGSPIPNPTMTCSPSLKSGRIGVFLWSPCASPLIAWGKSAVTSPTALAAEDEAIFCAALATGKAKRERAEMIGATITECAKALFFLDSDQAVGVGPSPNPCQVDKLVLLGSNP